MKTIRIILSVFAFLFSTIDGSEMSAQENPASNLSDIHHFHRGHSHNDYEQDQPLFKALRLGFKSIEADIHPYRSHLKVCHNASDFMKSNANLEDLYLYPLDSIIIANGGFVYPGDSTPVVLMIDLKTKKKKSVRLLRELLKNYNHHLYKREDGKDTWGPIQILLSGDPDLKQLSILRASYLFIDGRFGREYPKEVEPMVSRVSGNYNRLINRLPAKQQQSTIEAYVKQCHDRNQKIRFWATPDRPEFWDMLADYGVDWIGVDDLEKYKSYIDNK